MPGATPRLPGALSTVPIGTEQDFHVSEFGPLPAMSPFGQDIEFPLPWTGSDYQHPHAGGVSESGRCLTTEQRRPARQHAGPVIDRVAAAALPTTNSPNLLRGVPTCSPGAGRPGHPRQPPERAHVVQRPLTAWTPARLATLEALVLTSDAATVTAAAALLPGIDARTRSTSCAPWASCGAR